MPDKTIYVAEADVPVLTRAGQELPGSLSSNIVAGLRALLARQDASTARFEDVTVTVEEDGMKREVTFRGRCLARDEKYANGGRVHEEQRIYATAGGRFAHYARTEANWNYWSEPRHEDDATSLDGVPETRSFTVAETLAGLAHVAPQALIDAAARNEAKPSREYLDI